MSDTPEFEFDWDGTAMLPVTKDRRRCEEEFVPGRRYRLAPVEERSGKSHRHQFADIRHAWDMLPESLKHVFPTAERLRKHALCRTGYCAYVPCILPSREEALATVAKLRRLAEVRDETFWLVTVEDRTIHQYFPMSQSYKAMGKKQFQESKDACLRWIANDLIGVSVDDLKHYAKNAA